VSEVSEKTHPLYLRDLADLLIREARRAAADAPDPPGDWDIGYLTALVSALDLMKQQAVAFGLPLTDLGPLAELDPERDVLPRPVD
jgi:hypothetical protein